MPKYKKTRRNKKHLYKKKHLSKKQNKKTRRNKKHLYKKKHLSKKLKKYIPRQMSRLVAASPIPLGLANDDLTGDNILHIIDLPEYRNFIRYILVRDEELLERVQGLAGQDVDENDMEALIEDIITRNLIHIILRDNDSINYNNIVYNVIFIHPGVNNLRHGIVYKNGTRRDNLIN